MLTEPGVRNKSRPGGAAVMSRKVSTVGLTRLSRKLPPNGRFSGLVRGCVQGFQAFRHSCKIEFSPLSILRMASVSPNVQASAQAFAGVVPDLQDRSALSS